MSKKSVLTPGQAMHLERLSRALAGHKNKLPPARKQNSAPTMKTTSITSLMDQVNSLIPYAEKGKELNQKLFGDEYATLGLLLKGKRPGGLLGSLIPGASTKSGVAVNTNATANAVKSASPAALSSAGETVMTAPANVGVSSSSRTAIHFAKAPAVAGAGEGIRITATFLGPNIVRPRSTSSGTDSSAFAKLGNDTAPAIWLHLNPGDDTYTWLVYEIKSAAPKVTFALPLMSAVPRLAAMARNFTRFRCRRVDVEYMGRLGTQQTGVVRFSRLDDPIKALEIPDDAITTSGDQAFAWVSDLEKGFECPAWSARAKFNLLDDKSKGSLTTLQYVATGLNDPPSTSSVPGNAACRQNTPCFIGAVTDAGRNTADVNIILGRTFWTVTYDFYGLVIGPQSNSSTLRFRVLDASSGSVSTIDKLPEDDSEEKDSIELKEIPKGSTERKEDDLVMVTKEPPTPTVSQSDPPRVVDNSQRSDSAQKTRVLGTVPSPPDHRANPMVRSAWF